jgi:Transglutaminase-like superfamily
VRGPGRHIRVIRAVTIVAAVLLYGAQATAPVASATQEHGAILGTLVMRGSVSSTSTITMTGAFSVGHAAELNWDLPRLTTTMLNGYSQHVNSLSFRFNVPPAGHVEATVHGLPVRRFHWIAPPVDRIITVVETVRVVTRSDLSPLNATARYPLTALPGGVAPYLRNTAFTQLPASAHTILQRLQSGKSTERAVVEAVANWVASTTQYRALPTTYPQPAALVIANHSAGCSGYANVTAGLLRSMGIPTRIEYGWVSNAVLRLPGPQHGTSFVRWPAAGDRGLHVWLSVYFPGAGWVPFDPQHEKFFVDPRHFSLMSAIDAGDQQLGTWSAPSSDGLSSTGATLANGQFQIVPGDGPGSTIHIDGRDSSSVTLQRVQHDVTDVLLFSR